MGIIKLSDVVGGGEYLHYMMLKEPSTLEWCVAYTKRVDGRIGAPRVYRVYRDCAKDPYINWHGCKMYLGYITSYDYKQG